MKDSEFRAWNTHNKKMTYGVLRRGLREVFLNPELYVVMQHISGKIDVNNCKIFEGDIVVVHSEIFDGDIGSRLNEADRFVVTWLDDTARFAFTQNDVAMFDFAHYDGEQLEVVGNIYENPELLTPNIDELKRRYLDGISVNYTGDDDYDDICCPICNYSVARRDDYESVRPKHCPKCGTKLVY